VGGVGVASAVPGGVELRDEDAPGTGDTQGSGPSDARVVFVTARRRHDGRARVCVLRLLRPAVPCLNFANLRELAREFVPEMTEGKSHFWVVGGVWIPVTKGKVAKLASRFGKGS
jgi:hypothetical protein